jgi:hypothetical protein
MTVEGNDLYTMLLMNKTVTMMAQGNRALNEMHPKETGLELFVMVKLSILKGEKCLKCVSMVMLLKRKPATELLTTFLPSILLMIITFATSFLSIENFDTGLGTNLTNMLLLLTIFTAKIAELPPTSEVKMIDKWLVGCLLYPFIDVLLQILLVRLSKGDTEEPDGGAGEGRGGPPSPSPLVIQVEGAGQATGATEEEASARWVGCGAKTLMFVKGFIPGEGESTHFRVFKVIGGYIIRDILS